MKGSLAEEYNASYFDFLLRGPSKLGVENPIAEWLPNWLLLNL